MPCGLVVGLGGVGVAAGVTGALPHTWPWWGQLLALVAILLAFGAGLALDGASEWPRVEEGRPEEDGSGPSP